MTTIFYIICLLLKFGSTFTIDDSVGNDTEQPIDDKIVTSESTHTIAKNSFEDSIADATHSSVAPYSIMNSIKNSTEYGNNNFSNQIREYEGNELNQIYFTNSSQITNIDNETRTNLLEHLPTNLSRSTNSFHDTNLSFDDLEITSEINYYNNQNENFPFNLTEMENDGETVTKNDVVLNEKSVTFNETLTPVDVFNDGDDRKTLINVDDKFDSQNITENEREERQYACADCTPSTDGIYHDTSYEPKHVKRDEKTSMYAYRGNSIHKQHINGNVLSSTENVFTIFPTVQYNFEQYVAGSTGGATTYTENVLNYLNNGDVGSTISGNDDKDVQENYENLTITNAIFELDDVSTTPTNVSLEPREFEDITIRDFYSDSGPYTKTLFTSTSAPNNNIVHNVVVSNLTETWPVRHAAVVEGDLILGGLMMVHSREETIMCGQIMPQGGIQALEAMLFTIDRINEIGLLPNIKLGAHILDDCDRDTYGLEMAVDFIKGTFCLFIYFYIFVYTGTAVGSSVSIRNCIFELQTVISCKKIENILLLNYLCLRSRDDSAICKDPYEVAKCLIRKNASRDETF